MTDYDKNLEQGGIDFCTFSKAIQG